MGPVQFHLESISASCSKLAIETEPSDNGPEQTVFRRTGSCPAAFSRSKLERVTVRRNSKSYHPFMLRTGMVRNYSFVMLWRECKILMICFMKQNSFKQIAELLLLSPKKMLDSASRTLYISYKTLCQSDDGSRLLLLSLSLKANLEHLMCTCGHGRFA